MDDWIGIVITILFVSILAWHIVRFVRMVRNRKSDKAKREFGILLCGELLSIVIAVILAYYFDNAEGYGMMPGLTWIFHWLVSIAAMFVYVAMLIVTLIVWLVQTRRI